MRGAVCIVSPGNLASNPRVLKEADALHEAGYAVTAVVCDYTEALRAFDDEIAAGARWNVVRVPRSSSERPIGMLAGSVAKLAGTHLSVAWAARAYGGPAAALTRAASGLPADLYIGHYIAGLAAAGRAARRRDAMLGFDAEDLHTGEGTELQARMVQTIEDVLLPSCHHVTAAAPMIGKAYHARYGVDPVTVLNVFPLAMAPTQPSSAGKGTFRAYWFSQTIGLDRGLQAFIQAMARVTTRVTLDIRGGDRWGHGDRLMELARELGVAEHVYMLPMAAPQEMVRLAADYDVGLSLETDVSESRRVCLTNKIFTYLLAGVPVLLSNTPAQGVLALELGVAAHTVSLADPDGIAAVLDRLAASSGTRAEARDTAWRLGRERYNWDVEKAALLSSVDRAFAGRRVAA